MSDSELRASAATGVAASSVFAAYSAPAEIYKRDYSGEIDQLQSALSNLQSGGSANTALTVEQAQVALAATAGSDDQSVIEVRDEVLGQLASARQEEQSQTIEDKISKA